MNKWDDFLRIVLLAAVPSRRRQARDPGEIAKAYKLRVGEELSDRAAKLRILQRLKLIAVSQKCWRRTQFGDEVLTLTRAVLDDCRVAPDDWTRLDELKAAQARRNTQRCGSFCRTVERLAILSLLERRQMSTPECRNALSWICGPDSQVGFADTTVKQMQIWGLIVREGERLVLADEGRRWLELARSALYAREAFVQRGWQNWRSVIGCVGDAAPRRRWRSKKPKPPKPKSKPAQPPAAVETVEELAPLQQSLRFLLKDEFWTYLVGLAVAETPEMHAESQHCAQWIAILQQRGMVQTKPELAVTDAGADVLLLFRALLPQSGKLYLVGDLMPDLKLLRGCVLRAASLGIVAKVAAEGSAVTEHMLMLALTRIFGGRVADQELRQTLQLLKTRDWLTGTSLRVQIGRMGELRLRHLERLLFQHDVGTYGLDRLLSVDIAEHETDRQQSADGESPQDESWCQALRRVQNGDEPEPKLSLDELLARLRE